MKRLSIGLLLFSLGCLDAAPNAVPQATTEPTLKPGVGAARLGVLPITGAANSSSNDADDAEAGLTLGSPAPALQVNRFLKGDPVEAFEPGKVYVVEFWATWCGPCIAAMPHVTALQKQYPEVTFIGVNVWEDDDTAAEKFLEAQGDKIGYRIARDKIPPGQKAHDGAMALNWLTASGSNGIPAAFVVDGQGRIANITHPMSLDQSLPLIIEGKWDLAAAAEQRRAEKLAAKKQAELGVKLQALLRGPATDESLASLDQLATEYPANAPTINMLKFRLLLASADKTELAVAEGQKLLKSELAKNPEVLNAIAWEIVDPARKKLATSELHALALEAAKLADDATQQKSAAIADTLARAQFVAGDVKAAVESQRRAVSLAETTPGMEAVAKELKQRLTEYDEAATPAKP